MLKAGYHPCILFTYSIIFNVVISAESIPTFRMRQHHSAFWIRHGTSTDNQSGAVSIKISSNFLETIWPTKIAQKSALSRSNGFELSAEKLPTISLAEAFHGRTWDRINCSFLTSTLPNSVCLSEGNCSRRVKHITSNTNQMNHAERAFLGINPRTFNDISLVDRFNTGMTIVRSAIKDSTILQIVTNQSRVASLSSLAQFISSWILYSSFNSTLFQRIDNSKQLPFVPNLPDQIILECCPWNNQVDRPPKTQEKAYSKLNENIQRPLLQPGYTLCAKSNDSQDFCPEKCNSLRVCSPDEYSPSAKQVHRDVYTCTLGPAGASLAVLINGNWQVMFCPLGKSTKIISTVHRLHKKLTSVAARLKTRKDLASVALFITAIIFCCL